MKKLFNYLTLTLFSMSLFFISCSKDNDDKSGASDTANAQVALTLKSILQDVKAANSSTSGDDNNENDDDYGDDCLEFLECFEFQFPLTAIQTDGTQVEINDDEGLFNFIEAQEDDYEPNFVFPITIILDDDETRVLNSLEDLDEAFDYCEDEFECFELVFPITLIDENDNQVVINNEEELFAFIDSQSDDYEIEVVYPVEVSIDGEIITIANDDEMEELYEECDDDWDDVMCFEFVFPIQMTENGEVVTINDEDELFDFIEGIEDGEEIDFVYPFDVLLEDDSTLTINTGAEFFALLESCL
ncbi:MAG: hypothetical protein AAFP76_00775 [Bacteroidota bacterium]